MPRKAKKKVGRPKKISTPAPTSTSPVSMARSAMDSLRSALTTMKLERNRLDSNIAQLERMLHGAAAPAPSRNAAVVTVSPASAGAGAGAGFRSGSLKDFIAQVMGGAGDMAVKDIADAVVNAGYRSKNKTLAKSVGIALTEMPGVEKVGRGRFVMH